MSIGLTSSILNTKFIVGDESRLQTNRIQNPNAMMCPVWNGSDLAGRPVCDDTFYTKKEGCNSSLDRIKVENFLRPNYTNFVTISAIGITGDDANYGPNLSVSDSLAADNDRTKLSANNGRFGLISTEAIRPSSSRMEVEAANAYQSADANAIQAQNSRVNQNLNIGYNSQKTYNRMNVPKVNPNTTYTVNQFGNYEAQGARLSGYATLGNY